MDFFQVIILAILQGLTEFLPISSSAHLILPSQILGWEDQGLAFDIAVHVGSLIAVVSYFRKDLKQLAGGFFQSVSTRTWNQDCALVIGLAIATLPAALAGVLLDDFIEAHLRSTLVIALSTLLFGLLLGWADSAGKGKREIEHMGLGIVVLIGIAQAFALIPGTSRSGVTMTAALFLGLSRDAAARFSFLLSIPLIAGVGLYKTLDLFALESVPWLEILTGTALSAITAFLCIHWFLKLLDRIGFMPFVIYRVFLSFILLFIYFVY